MEFHASPLREEDSKADFQSRDSELNDFLAKEAWPCEQSECTRTFVVRRLDGDNHPPYPIYGFYSICMKAVDLRDLPAGFLTLPVPTPPVVLLCMFARDARLSDELGVAPWMIGDLARRVASLADEIGCTGILLETKYEKLVEYYKRYGFVPINRRGRSGTGKFRMLLPIQDVRATVAELTRGASLLALPRQGVP
jgi:hypothetical protein